MRLTQILVFGLPFLVRGANIIQSNDDGWAEANIRAFYDALKAAGNDVVVSAPATEQSGRGKCIFESSV